MSEAWKERFAEAQRVLGQALDSAKLGEDRELAAQIRDEGHALVRLLFGLLRMTKVHASDNYAFDKPLQELAETLDRLVDLLGVVHLLAVENQVYLNDVRVRFMERGEGAAELGEELRRLDVGGLTFHAPPSVEQLRLLIRGFARPPVGAVSRQALSAQLAAKGATNIELHGLFRFRTSGEEVQADTGRDPHLVLHRAVGIIDKTWDDLVAGRIPNALPLRRAVTEILELGPELRGVWEDPPEVSAMAAHTMRVARYCIMVGRALGLTEDSVQDLGLAAMFHDMGYAAREGAVAATAHSAGKPGRAPPFARHPGSGARLLLQQRGFHEAKIRRALAALEHHRDYDDHRGRPALFSRILRICEDYDNLVRQRGGGQSPPDALARMVAGAGRRYDPVILQVFINVMGAYPPGTLMQLKDGRVVRSLSAARADRTWDRPLCRLEVQADGTRLEDDEWLVDLALEGDVAGTLDRI